MSGDEPLFGALETGGTSTRVAVATSAAAGRAAAGGADRRFVARDAFPTTTPEETVARAAAFFARRRIAALGVAAFGPIDLEPGSPRHGALLSTPKPGWSRFPLRERLAGLLDVAVHVETDVNAAALAEQGAALAAGIDAPTLAYVTVGTGIGVGLALGGRAHHGALHPEAGHLFVRRAAGDAFAGLCPFHHDCLEGLASGPAIAARAGADPSKLPPTHDAWRIEADYLAQLAVAIVGLLAPQQIVLGGGVMSAPRLLDAVRVRAVELLNGYSPLLDANSGATAAALLVAPRLGADSALIGALELAVPADPLPDSLL